MEAQRMSEEKQEAVKAPEETDELSELLDSALKDFKPTGKKPTTDDELDALMETQDQKAAQKAAGDFQEMLAQMVKVQEEAMRKAAEEGVEAPQTDEDSAAMMEAIKQLMDCSSQVANAGSPEEFMAGLDMLRSPDSPMEPFMAMVMQTLASKTVMYPPLKEIHDNFPKYFEEHGSELDAETRGRYDKQYEVLGRICAEFESQPDEPVGVAPENAAAEPVAPEGVPPVDVQGLESFERLGKLLVELQSHGYPPKELVGALPDGWGIDNATGMPKVEDTAAAADACTIM